jgi:hypothetical protein
MLSIFFGIFEPKAGNVWVTFVVKFKFEPKEGLSIFVGFGVSSRRVVYLLWVRCQQKGCLLSYQGYSNLGGIIQLNLTANKF